MSPLLRSGAARAGTRELLLGRDPRAISWALMARSLMVVWLLGGCAMELWLAGYGSAAAQPHLALAVAVAAQVVGVLIGLCAGRVPGRLTGHAILLGATVAVTFGLWTTRGVASGADLIYLWLVPYAFVLVGARAAVVHIAVTGAAWLTWAATTDPSLQSGRWIFVAATLVALGFVSAHLLASLRGSQQLLHRAFEDATLGMAMVGDDGCWIALNGALRSLLGRSNESLSGMPVGDFLDPRTSAPQAIRRPSGGRRWVEVTRSAVHDDRGRVACWALQVLDVTERRAAEADLRSDAEQARWADEVRAALREDRIALYTQPLLSLCDGSSAGHELLARLVLADGAIVAPGAFMPAVERFGLAPEFDAHVLRRAVDILATGRAVHVNLSAHSVGRPELITLLRDALDATGADPGRLTLEITETALTADIDAFAQFGREVTHLGCRLALDDFGTGYGTLTYLTSLPVTEIKIDQRFVQGLRSDAASAEVVRAVVGLAGRLQLCTVAEGVEDAETLALVRELGVDVAQGYLLGRPAPLEPAGPAELARAA
jgi:EAL domain-containing protein (putative c-di-GMP-specific phosphodiesterase class I)